MPGPRTAGRPGEISSETGRKIMKRRVAVIGAGASGLIASVVASESCYVVLFEKQKKIGRKLLVTGNGRCNISNTGIEKNRYHGHNPGFVNNVFAKFGLPETESFFSSIGIPFVEENEGKLFPASLQASLLPKVFEYELASRKVELRLHRRIDKIIPLKKGFRVVTAGMEEEEFDTVVLSCGSCAFPQTGASRAGYELAESLGHTVHEPFPVITPLNIPLKALHRLQGIKWDCGVRVYHKKKVVAESCDELLFTAYGISGPASLKVSRRLNELILKSERPEIEIDFFPGSSAAELRGMIDILMENRSKKLGFSLLGILKERVPEVVLPLAGIDPEKRNGTVTAGDIEAIVSVLKGLRLEPGKCRGFDDAVAAAGGVSVDEINPLTMESKIVKGVYITGELLDIDGDSGGFNLQFAWSTGAIAGMSQLSE